MNTGLEIPVNRHLESLPYGVRRGAKHIRSRPDSFLKPFEKWGNEPLQLTIGCHYDIHNIVIAPVTLPTPHQPLIYEQPAGRSTEPGGRPIAELFTEINALAVRLRQRATKIEGVRGDLPGAEHAVLDLLDRFGDMTVPHIARERCTSRQNIQILVDRLERAGRVEVITNPAHKRSGLVRLTETGKKWLADSERERKDLLLEIESRLSEPELNAAVFLLRKVHGLLSGLPATEPSTQSLHLRHTAPTVGNLSPNLAVEAEEFPINLL
jgi:DNA-binding MarR family transcriptional regulator